MRQKIIVFSCSVDCVGEYEDNRQCQWIYEFVCMINCNFS